MLDVLVKCGPQSYTIGRYIQEYISRAHGKYDLRVYIPKYIMIYINAIYLIIYLFFFFMFKLINRTTRIIHPQTKHCTRSKYRDLTTNIIYHIYLHYSVNHSRKKIITFRVQSLQLIQKNQEIISNQYQLKLFCYQKWSLLLFDSITPEKMYTGTK